jgi:hypothetical protein
MIISTKKGLGMKKFWLVVLISVSINNPQAQVAEIAGSATVDTLITNVKNGISELISEAEASATVVGFSFASDANILIQNLDILGKELSGKVFSDLNRSQQSALSNAAAVLAETDKKLQERIRDVNNIIDSLGAELSRLPLADDRPLLKRYSPSYILNNDASYDINFDGSLLNTDSIKLQFGAVPCQKISSVENSLKFNCPAEIFKNSENNWITGNIDFTKKKAWYNIFGQDKSYSYSLGIMAIQEKFGDYKLLVSEKVNDNNVVQRLHKNQFRNSHCSGNRSKVWTYRPTEGCTIDITSAKISEQSVTSKSSLEGIINLASNGFQIRGVIGNSGSCGPFGVPKDARGKIAVTATWNDICPTPKEVDLPPAEGEIFWNNDLSFDLPQAYTKFSLEVKQLDGTKKIVKDTESHRWFTTHFDVNGKQLILKPRTVEDAFK